MFHPSPHQLFDTQFLSQVAHELKNPIATLKLFAQIHRARFQQLGNDALSSEELDLVDAELNRMVRLIDDILDDTRIESGRLNFNFEAVDLKQIIDEVVEKMSLVTPDHPIINQSISGAPVIADSQRIEQVLINLITNAAKYSAPGKKIEILLVNSKKQVRVSVKDQGIGIPKDKLASVFERFYQIQKQSSSGFGLGLYISKKVIDAHNGLIWARSREGKGSTFNFTLPFAP